MSGSLRNNDWHSVSRIGIEVRPQLMRRYLPPGRLANQAHTLSRHAIAHPLAHRFAGYAKGSSGFGEGLEVMEN